MFRVSRLALVPRGRGVVPAAGIGSHFSGLVGTSDVSGRALFGKRLHSSAVWGNLRIGPGVRGRRVTGCLVAMRRGPPRNAAGTVRVHRGGAWPAYGGCPESTSPGPSELCGRGAVRRSRARSQPGHLSPGCVVVAAGGVGVSEAGLHAVAGPTRLDLRRCGKAGWRATQTGHAGRWVVWPHERVAMRCSASVPSCVSGRGGAAATTLS